MTPDATPFDAVAMRRALELAEDAMRVGEVPVGAVVTRGREIVSEAFNLREARNDPTAHAERIALTLAGEALGRWNLFDCTLYATLEPCPMCAGAVVLSRIERVVFGARDWKAGACLSLYRLTSDRRLNHRVKVESGLLGNECAALMSTFFARLRKVERP